MASTKSPKLETIFSFRFERTNFFAITLHVSTLWFTLRPSFLIAQSFLSFFHFYARSTPSYQRVPRTPSKIPLRMSSNIFASRLQPETNVTLLISRSVLIRTFSPRFGECYPPYKLRTLFSIHSPCTCTYLLVRMLFGG